MPTTHIITSRFPLGRVGATTALVAELESAGLNPELEILTMLARHAGGDWGELDAFDKMTNDAAVLSGHDRILSRYEVGDSSCYVITEWDRSSTMVMRCIDY